MATLSPRVYTDLDLNFIPLPVSGDVSKNVGDLAVIRSIENLVRLNHFEAPFQPQIGSGITNLLFELVSPTTANALQNEITNLIRNYEPRASVYYISVTPTQATNSDMDGYNLTMEFFVNNNPSPVAISMFLQRVGD